jgi:hypothetical protein
MSSCRCQEWTPVLLSLVFVLQVAALSQGCIESRCYQNADCPLGRICLKETGRCVEPECDAAHPCPPGHLCQSYFCQQGCLEDSECGEGQKCVQAQCIPYSEECDCQAAPEFCRIDQNPGSPSMGQEFCLEGMGEGGIALFFGSVKCSHCWALFQDLQGLRDELREGGLDVQAVFVHLKTVEATPSVVGEKMPWATAPVVFDSEELGIWEDFLADWYHVVIVDRHGCVFDHFGPVVSEDFVGPDSKIRNAWMASVDNECKGPAVVEEPEEDLVTEDSQEIVDVVEGPDLPDVPLPDLPEPTPEILEPEVDALADEVGEELVAEVAETVDDIPLDESDGAPFQPAELCQIVPTEPVAIGGAVPYFLCTDLNPASATFNGTFSPWSLKEKVWIAYFGSCT